jgi:UMF1 family MFS transporter
MFDFANSSFTTVIVTVVYSVYFTKLVCAGRSDGTFLWGLGLFLSQLVVLLTAPLLGAIADYSARKKAFLVASWMACCVATALLWLVEPGRVATGVALFVIANVAFSVGENLTASFLPELARPEDMGKISGFGWAWGYVGGLAALLLVQPLTSGGFVPENDGGLRATSLVTAAFFALAGLPTILLLRERATSRPLPEGKGYARVGMERVGETLHEVRRFRELFKFLIVFFVYNCGIANVVAYAAIFAEREVRLTPGELALFFLVVQVTSAVGAVIFGLMQDRMGARITLQVSLVVWTVMAVGFYLVSSKAWFFVLGNLAGLALGSSQSGARALVGTLSPASRSAEVFGFWGLFWKASSAVGPLLFGALETATGDLRLAILSTAAVFLAGLLGMFVVDERAGREAARAAEASTS